MTKLTLHQAAGRRSFIHFCTQDHGDLFDRYRSSSFNAR
jgi:hypothetical protein